MRNDLRPLLGRPPRADSTFPKLAPALLVACLLALGTAGCDEDNSGQFYEPAEANVLLVTAFAAKDAECGTTTPLTVPLIVRVDREDLDACTAQVVSTSCSAWSGEDPTPALCLAMLVDL